MSRSASSSGASTSNTSSPANSHRSGRRGRGRNTQPMRPSTPPTPSTPPETPLPSTQIIMLDNKDIPRGVYIKRPRFKLCNGSFMVDLFKHGPWLIGHNVDRVILPIFNSEKQMMIIEYDANGNEIARHVMKSIAEVKKYGVFSTVDELFKKVEKDRQQNIRNNPESTS